MAKEKDKKSQSSKKSSKTKKSEKEEKSVPSTRALWITLASIFVIIIIILIVILGYTKNKINEVKENSYQGIDKAEEASEKVGSLKEEIEKLKKIAGELDQKIDKKVEELQKLEEESQKKQSDKLIVNPVDTEDWKTVTNKGLHYRLKFPDTWEVEKSSKDDLLILQPKDMPDYAKSLQIRKVLAENDAKSIEEKNKAVVLNNLQEEFHLSENVIGNYRYEKNDKGEIPVVLLFTPESTLELSFQAASNAEKYQDLTEQFEEITATFEYIVPESEDKTEE